MLTIHNCHIHSFSNQHVPDGFLPLNALKFLRQKPVAGFASKLLKFIIPLSQRDILNRVAVFLDIGSLDSQEAILQHIRSFYPRDSKFVVLSLDMDYMKAGKPPQDFLSQLAELKNLRKKYPNTIIPFVAADPRRSKVTKVVMNYIDHHGFGGVKLYPPLGYFPFDDRLHEVFHIAQARQIPIISHCSRGGIHVKGKIAPEMRIHPKSGKVLKGRSNAEFSDHYTDPANYKWLLDDFPRLKICLAHFGGAIEWKKYLSKPRPAGEGEKLWFKVIKDLIETYENVYADVAFTAADQELWPLLKVLLNSPGLREKILFGSDAYMVQLAGSEREFSIGLRGYLGERDYRQIAETNPKRFLAFEAAPGGEGRMTNDE